MRKSHKLTGDGLSDKPCRSSSRLAGCLLAGAAVNDWLWLSTGAVGLLGPDGGDGKLEAVGGAAAVKSANSDCLQAQDIDSVRWHQISL